MRTVLAIDAPYPSRYPPDGEGVLWPLDHLHIATNEVDSRLEVCMQGSKSRFLAYFTISAFKEVFVE